MKTTASKPPLPILIVPSETPPATVKKLEVGGYLVIATDEFNKVKLVAPTNFVGKNNLLMSALHGLTKGNDTTSMNIFTREIHRRLLEQEVATKTVGCAACDRGDYQLGHAEGCAKKGDQ